MIKPIRHYFLFFILFCSQIAVAQNAIAFKNSNYGGVFSLHGNPANIVDSRYTTYINFGNIELHHANNFYRNGNPHLFDVVQNGLKLNKNAAEISTRGNFLSTGFDVKGLSIVQKINKNNAIAISTRLRGNQQANGVSPNFYDMILNGNVKPTTFKNAGINLNTQIFHEIDLTYGRVILNRGEHFLKSGFTAKLLTGIYTIGATAKGIYGQTSTNDSGKEGIDFSEGKLNLRHFGSENIEKSNLFTYNWADLSKTKVGNGVGFDLGFVYEFRPDYKSSFVKRRTRSRAKGTYANETSPIKYKFKVALALTDFGKINYKNDSIKSYTIDLKDKKFGAEIDGKFQYQQLFALTQTKKEDFVSNFTASIPSTLQLNADYRLEGDFFLNLSAQQNLRSKSTVGTRSASYIALTPRLERKHYEISLPFAFVNNYKNFTVGTAFRIGPLMIGTDNILGVSGLFKNTNGSNIYAGLHLGFQDKKISAPLIVRKAPAKLPKGQKVPSKIPVEYDENGDEIPNTLSNGKAKVMAKSAEKEKPAPKKPLVPANMDNIERFDKCITFFYEKNTLMSSAYTCLGDMCKYYTKNKNIKLRITGCMLELEKSAEPEKLKLSRARAIRNYLIQSGFPPSQISIAADKKPSHTQTVIFQKVE